MTLDDAKKPPTCGHWEAQTGCHNCKERTRALLPEFPLQVDRNYDRPGPIAVPWSVAEMAWAVYAQKYGTQQSVERMAQRGGFGWSEMDAYYPAWRTETLELLQLRARLAELNGTPATRFHALMEKLEARFPDPEPHRSDEVPEARYIAALDRALEELADIKTSFRATVNEPCAPDEVHCSCVPALREKLRELEDELAHEKGGRIDEATIREHLSSRGLPSYGPILNAVQEALVAMDRDRERALVKLQNDIVAEFMRFRNGRRLEFDEADIRGVPLPAPSKDITFDLFFELSDAGKLQSECAHDAEPDFCDGCAVERERKQRDVWVKIRNWLKAHGRG